MPMSKGIRMAKYTGTFLLSILCMVSVAVDAQSKERVVSVAGSLTEIMYELKLHGSLIAVDTTSQWPSEAASLPQVGYQRALSAEGILSLMPTMVLATADAGPPEVLQQLIDAGVNITVFPRDYSIEGVFERINAIGDMFDQREEAQRLIDSMLQEQLTKSTLNRKLKKPKVAFLLGTNAGSAMASGAATAAHAMIEYAGATNTLSQYDGYKPVNAEALIKAAPDVLVVVAHGSDVDSHIVKEALALPGVALTPAGENQHVIVVDALRFLGFGPRMMAALYDLTRKLHDDVSAQ